MIAIEYPGCEATLKKMADPVVTTVEAHCIQPVQPLHSVRKLRLSRPDDEVEVVRHQGPGEHVPVEACRHLSKLRLPPVAVERVADDRASRDAAGGDVIDGGGRQLGASSSGHSKRR